MTAVGRVALAKAVTEVPVDPDPTVWPECSECHVAYVKRRGLSFSKGWIWVWQQDCKHKKAAAIVVNADGPVPL